MGLDMYLKRGKKIPKVSWEEYKEIRNKVLQDDKDTMEKYKDYIVHCGEHFKWDDLVDEVGYWRKANQIHNWIVEHCQDGVDDCGLYQVSKSDLESLLFKCKSIVKCCPMIDGEVVNGYIYKDGEKIPNIEQGKVMTNSYVAESILPTASGCFFGGTNYDEYYMRSIINTITIIEKVLNETNFDEEYICYESSW